MKYIKKIAVKQEVTMVQLVNISMANQLCRILLNDKELTKEEMLMSLMIEECDGEGIIQMNDENKRIALEITGMTLKTYQDCLYNWRAKGIITSSGKYVKFAVWLNKNTTQGIFIQRHS